MSYTSGKPPFIQDDFQMKEELKPWKILRGKMKDLIV